MKKRKKRTTTWIGLAMLFTVALLTANQGVGEPDITATNLQENMQSATEENVGEVQNVIQEVEQDAGATGISSQITTFGSLGGGLADGAMEVHFIDVGQGDATLILCGEDAMLIDAGDNTKGTLVQNYLEKRGISELNYLILTHPDSDHIGGAAVIVTKFELGMVFMSDYEKENKTFEGVLQALENRSFSWSTPKVGNTYQLGSAEFTILAPNDSYSDPNDASIALLVENGEDSFLFTGDAEEKAESDIVANGLNIQADVYQAGHHGSKTSSSAQFLDAVAPTYAVISCGQDNSYGHPSAQTLNAFRERGIQVFRTDEQGSIIAFSDGLGNITWNCAPSDTWKTGEPTGSAQSH